MNTTERDHRKPDASDDMIRVVHLCLEKARMSFERAAKAIAKSWQAIEQSRALLASSVNVYPPEAGMPSPAPQAIIITSSTAFVSQPVLDRADEEVRRAELEYVAGRFLA
jgi:hypothetical protein